MTDNFDVNVNQCDRFFHFHQSSRHSLGVYGYEIVARIRHSNPVQQWGVEGEHQGLSSFRLDLTGKRRDDLKDAVAQVSSGFPGKTGVQDDVRVGVGVLLETLGQISFLLIPVFSTLIGRGSTRLVSHWSRASECWLRQQSYAMKNHLVATRGLWMPELVFYDIRLLATPRNSPRHRGGQLCLILAIKTWEISTTTISHDLRVFPIDSSDGVQGNYRDF